MAHGRRGFEEAIPSTSHPLVHEAMIWTRQLYDMEDRAREMSPDERRVLRQAEALPILARLAEHPEHRLEQREEESREARARRQRRRGARRLLAAQ